MSITESEWFKERPLAVQTAIRLKPPGTYLLATTNQTVHIRAYSENKDGSCDTCTVYILAKDNPEQANTPFPDREVFGIALADLIPRS